jgi:signal transduction histidine kinase
MAASFRSELIKKSPEPIDLYEVSLDTARALDPKAEAPFIDYIHAVLSGRKPELIVPVGAPAAFFLQRHRQEVYPETPMLIVGADVRRLPGAARGEDDAAVLLDLDLPAYIANILRLLPQTTEIAVVVGTSPVERFWASELRRDFQPYEERVKITWLSDLSFSEMLRRAATMLPQTAIFWFLMSEDAAGIPYSQDRALEAMRQVGAVPIFGMGDYQMGRGIVGGPLMQTEALGHAAAEVAVRILRGEKQSGIDQPLVTFGAPVYDWRELRRWKIEEVLLPPGSIVQFREPSLWERYQWQIASTATLFLFQAVLITWLVFERHLRKRSAEQASRARMESGRYRENLAHLARVRTVGEMSTAIAHEVNQPLVAIKNYALAAQRRLSNDGSTGSAKVRELLDKIGAQASRAGDVLQSLRAMVRKHESKPTTVAVGELVANALKLVELASGEANVRVEASIAPNLPALVVDGIQIQQVVLNLSNNAIEAMEEAGITNGVIKVEVVGASEGGIAVTVADTGPGIAPGDAERVFDPFFSSKKEGLGVGLSICRAIVEAHGGRLSLSPNQGGGSVFTFTLPAGKEGS